MIQTDTCEICGGGIYRDVNASWDDDYWSHMQPELQDSPHRARPKIRSIHDDDPTE